MIGILAALLEVRESGKGQVVDAAIVDGTAHLNLIGAMMLGSGMATEERGKNLLDGGLPNYSVYITSDDKHMSVGPLEPRFLAQLLTILRIDSALTEDPGALRAKLTEVFATKTQAEWFEIFDGTDACVAPILPFSEAVRHPHMAAREVFVERDGITQPQPAPRFSRTEATLSMPPAERGEHT